MQPVSRYPTTCHHRVGNFLSMWMVSTSSISERSTPPQYGTADFTAAPGPEVVDVVVAPAEKRSVDGAEVEQTGPGVVTRTGARSWRARSGALRRTLKIWAAKAVSDLAAKTPTTHYCVARSAADRRSPTRLV